MTSLKAIMRESKYGRALPISDKKAKKAFHLFNRLFIYRHYKVEKKWHVDEKANTISFRILWQIWQTELFALSEEWNLLMHKIKKRRKKNCTKPSKDRGSELLIFSVSALDQYDSQKCELNLNWNARIFWASVDSIRNGSKSCQEWGNVKEKIHTEEREKKNMNEQTCLLNVEML